MYTHITHYMIAGLLEAPLLEVRLHAPLVDVAAYGLLFALLSL